MRLDQEKCVDQKLVTFIFTITLANIYNFNIFFIVGFGNELTTATISLDLKDVVGLIPASSAIHLLNSTNRMKQY